MAISVFEYQELKRRVDTIWESYTELRRKTDKTYLDMYEGENKENPSMTVRMDRVEQVLDSVKTIKTAAITAVIAMIVDIASHFIHF
jgi:hypothetical protein